MPFQDVVTWNAILEGYAMNGHGKEASSHIWNGCVSVSSHMISLLLVFCQLVAM
jgi:hypothetical protein